MAAIPFPLLAITLEELHLKFVAMLSVCLANGEGTTILDLVTQWMTATTSTSAEMTAALVEFVSSPNDDAWRLLRGAQVAHLSALASAIHVVDVAFVLTAPLVEPIVEAPLMEPIIIPDVDDMSPLADEEVDTARV